MDQSLTTPSIVYNGDTMTKLEVMQYLCELVRLKKELDLWEERKTERNVKKKKIEIQQRRRTFEIPQKEKPTGLAALSSKKKREYQYWLSQASEREKEKQRREAEEDARIADLQAQSDALYDESEADFKRMWEVVTAFKEHCLLQIIAPEYRKDDIPQILLFYLFNGRAHTLTEAINLYHQELHWNKMETIAKEQMIQAQAAYYRQEQMMMEQAKMQQAQLHEISDAINDARHSAEEAAFYTKMNFLWNLTEQ